MTLFFQKMPGLPSLEISISKDGLRRFKFKVFHREKGVSEIVTFADMSAVKIVDCRQPVGIEETLRVTFNAGRLCL